LDSVDINSAFLNVLKYSDIPGEDWGMFLTRIGDKYLTANPHQIYANAHIYYSSHFIHKRLEQATASAIATAAATAAATSIKLIAIGLDDDSPRVLTIDNGDYCIIRAYRHGQGRGLQCKEYSTDPDGYCTFRRRAGHTIEQYQVHLQPPTTDIQCYNCNKFGHKSPDRPERNCYTPSLVLMPLPREPSI
jgi:hypothetical protein